MLVFLHGLAGCAAPSCDSLDPTPAAGRVVLQAGCAGSVDTQEERDIWCDNAGLRQIAVARPVPEGGDLEAKLRAMASLVGVELAGSSYAVKDATAWRLSGGGVAGFGPSGAGLPPWFEFTDLDGRADGHWSGRLANSTMLALLRTAGLPSSVRVEVVDEDHIQWAHAMVDGQRVTPALLSASKTNIFIRPAFDFPGGLDLRDPDDAAGRVVPYLACQFGDHGWQPPARSFLRPDGGRLQYEFTSLWAANCIEHLVTVRFDAVTGALLGDDGQTDREDGRYECQ